MRPMNIILAICYAVLLFLCYADRQEADEKAAQREAAVTKANAQRAARQAEGSIWIRWAGISRRSTTSNETAARIPPMAQLWIQAQGCFSAGCQILRLRRMR